MKDRAYEIARNLKHRGSQKALANMVYKCCDKKRGLGAIVNEELVKELYKTVSKKLKKTRFCPRIKDNIWAGDLGEMESLSSENWNDNYVWYMILKICSG